MVKIGFKKEEDFLRLKELGFENLSTKLINGIEKKKKMMLAYEFYRYVKPEKVDAFNAKLRKKTEENRNGRITYDKMVFEDIKNYDKLPEPHVLEALDVAKERKCFDKFEIGYITSVVELPDPILFGRVEGCVDRFFIAQWDKDVKIEDILLPNEG